MKWFLSSFILPPSSFKIGDQGGFKKVIFMTPKYLKISELFNYESLVTFEGKFVIKKLFLVSLVLLIVVSVGCNESDKSPILDDNDDSSLPALGSQFDLKVDQATKLKSEDISVKLLNVTNDSRCPSDVVCVWAGQVSVTLNITENGKNLGDVTLTLGVSNPDLAVKNIGDYSVKVIAVNPYPISTHKIEPSEYIVTLVVSKI